MRTALIVLLALLVVAVVCVSCTSVIRQHPVQPFPANWELPPDYAHCVKGDEQITWPDGRVTVTVECPSGPVFLDRRTKKVVDMDSLDFRGRR